MSWTFSFAQQNTCNTCGSTAPTLQQYLDMTTQLMSAIQAQSPEWPTVGAYDVPWLFGGGILQLDDESRDAITRSADAILRSIDQKMQATAAVGTILATNLRDIGRDNFLGLSLLTQNQAIVRDRAKLQRLSSIMQDKVFELALATARQKPLTVTDRTQLRDILTTYQQQWLLTVAALENTASYAQVMFTLQQMNRSFETFLAYGTIGQFDKTFSAWEESFYIRFNMQAIEQMQQDYACARFGDQCAGNLKQFVTDMKTLGSENIQAARTSGKDIIDASKKLKGAMQAFGKKTANFLRKKEKNKAYTPEEEAGLSRQDKLLRTVYGSDFKRMQNAILPTIRANVSPESFETIKDNMTQIGQQANYLLDPLQDITVPFASVTIDTGQLQWIPMDNTMNTLMAFTMQQMHNVWLQQSSYAVWMDPHPQTVYIPLLAGQLDTIRSIIGTKDTKGMLVHNLGTACELQCTNAWWTCWR
jgi:hypothetical protein